MQGIKRVEQAPTSTGGKCDEGPWASKGKDIKPGACPAKPWIGKIVTAPPTYAELGKNARDVFGSGYHFGLLKLDVKTKTSTGVEFVTGGVSNLETGKVLGTLESKYKFKEQGVSVAAKWNTDNIFGTDVSYSDPCDAVKVAASATFAPATGDKSLVLKTEFRNEHCALNFDTDFKQKKPVIRIAGVVGHAGWWLGYATGFDTSESNITENKFSLGFTAKDFVVNTSINDGKNYSGTLYHKVNPRLETGVQLGWSSESNETNFGIASKYNLDSFTSVKVKVDSKSMIGLAYSQKLSEGVTMYLSAQIDGKNINEGGHKMGFALDLSL